MKHKFSTEIAKELGINIAVIFDNLIHWMDENCKMNKNYKDGKYWTYNSIKEFHNVFYYLSERQISTALVTLEKLGYIITGNYNATNYDRTKWYSVTKEGFEYYCNKTDLYYDKLHDAIYGNVKSIMQKCKMDYAEMSNRNIENVEPIPIENTDIKTDDKTNNNNKGVSKKNTFDLSNYESELQIDINNFIQFRTEIKKKFTSQMQLDTFYKNLMKLSKNDIEVAKQIIDTSITNGWQGIFELKTNQKGNNGNYKQQFGENIRREDLRVDQVMRNLQQFADDDFSDVGF